MEQARSFAKAFGSDIVLMHVVPLEPLVVDFEPPAVPPDIFKERQRELLAMRDSLTEQGVNVTAQLFGGLLLETVLDQIKLLNPDIVIMGSHGHGALYQLIVGSVTEGIIKRSARPVLVIPSMPVPQTTSAKAAKKIRSAKAGGLAGVLGGAPAPL